MRLDPVASLRVEVRLEAASPLSPTGSGQRSDLLESKVIQRCHVMSREGNLASPGRQSQHALLALDQRRGERGGKNGEPRD